MFRSRVILIKVAVDKTQQAIEYCCIYRDFLSGGLTCSRFAIRKLWSRLDRGGQVFQSRKPRVFATTWLQTLTVVGEMPLASNVLCSASAIALSKELANRKRHGIDFRTAAKVFLDPYVIEFDDLDATDELRFSAIALVEGRMPFVSYTMRGDVICFLAASSD
jgi:uncharacterized DUF497 family protein